MISLCVHVDKSPAHRPVFDLSDHIDGIVSVFDQLDSSDAKLLVVTKDF